MSKNISLDPSLVAFWSTELSAEEPFEYPFKAEYNIGTKRLIYIASLHSCNANSPTFKMIENSVNTDRIDFLLLEGVPHSAGVSSEKIIKWACTQGKDGFYKGFETAFAVSLACQKNLPFIGGEPDDLFVMSEVLNEGYSAEDFVFYHFVQQVFQRSEAGSADADIEGLFNGIIQSKVETLMLPIRPSFDDFQKWYLDKNGCRFAPSEINAEVPAPFKNGALYTQKISAEICRIRDQFIVSTVDSLLKEHNSLMAIFGGSHWSTQKKAFASGLGSPSFSK